MAGNFEKSAEILDAVAVLVVDMQPAFLGVMDNAENVTARCGFAIETAQILGLKVVFTEQVPSKLGGTDPRLRARAKGARVFAKDAFSALQADGLQSYLKKQGVYHLLLAGIETPVCIYQTALHAIDFEFDATVLTDCVTGRRADDCQAVLESLARSNCHILPAETVFYSMLAASSHPRFRAFTEIVKRYSGPDPLSVSRPSAPSNAKKRALKKTRGQNHSAGAATSRPGKKSRRGAGGRRATRS